MVFTLGKYEIKIEETNNRTKKKVDNVFDLSVPISVEMQYFGTSSSGKPWEK